MKVKDYMFKKVCTIKADETISDAVEKMVKKGTNSLIVIDEDSKPVGILSSYTLIREVVPAYLKDDPIFSNYGAEGTFDKYAEKTRDKKIEEVMHTDFHVLKEEDAMIEAASYSLQVSRRIMPVVDNEGRLIGAITRTCIKNALYNVLFKDKQIDPRNGGCPQ